VCRKLIYLVLSVLFLGLSGSAARAQENQIINGEFTDVLDSWGVYNYLNSTTTAFSVEVVQDAGLSGRNALMIDITKASAVSSIGIAQSGLIIEPGVNYPIGFIAKAEQDREMVVLLQANINDQTWPTYLEQRVQLTTSLKTFVLEYTHWGSTIGDDPGETLTLYLMLKGQWWPMEGNNLNKKVWIDQVYFGAKSPPERNPIIAFDPSPADEETDVQRNVVLCWKPGIYADKHDVYLGTVFDDVNEADIANPRNVLVNQGQDPNVHDPAGLLEFNLTYYWRIDEVNAPPENTIYKGHVWSFTAEPFAYSIEDINATASSTKTGAGPENTINGSGLDVNDLHSMNNATMWISSFGGPQPVWLQYEFDRVYKLYQMWVWNYNGEFEQALGFGLKDVTLEYSTNSTDWQVLGDFEFAQAPGEEGYAHNTTVDLGGVAAKKVRITANSNWGGLAQYGLSEVRFFYKPVQARQPKPTSGQTGVALDAVLSWRAGREAVSHEVYFSSDMEAVINGTALVGTVSENNYELSSLDPFGPAQGGLELGKTYYWKINEVNEAKSPSSWEGEVWSFTTTQYLTVDDFEQYDDLCNRIFYTWIDGFGHSGDPACSVVPSGGNGTGSTVGNFNAPFAERGIVHEDRQSMPFEYNNSTPPNYSETQRQWAVPQDWTRRGVKRLTLWFYGGPGNSAEPLYVAVTDNLGTIKVVTHNNPNAIQAGNWQEWNIPLTDFVDVDLSSIENMYIGVGNRTTPQTGGIGKLHFDDIRLCFPLLVE